MRQLERNKRTVAVAQRDSVNGVEVYGTPISLKVNFRNTRGAASMDGLGEAIIGSLVAIVSPADAAIFREFDRVYVFVTPPLITDEGASEADYVVEAVLPNLSTTEIRLKRITL